MRISSVVRRRRLEGRCYLNCGVTVNNAPKLLYWGVGVVNKSTAVLTGLPWCPWSLRTVHLQEENEKLWHCFLTEDCQEILDNGDL